MAILAILIGAGASVLGRIGQPTARTAAESIRDSISAARSKAVTLNTHTRVAFGPCKVDGEDAIAAGIFISLTGSSSTSAADWKLAGPPMMFKFVTLQPAAYPGSGSIADNSLLAISTNAAGQTIDFQDGILVTPGGRLATTSGTPPDRYLSLKVANSLRASDPPTDLLVTSLSGNVEIRTN